MGHSRAKRGGAKRGGAGSLANAPHPSLRCDRVVCHFRVRCNGVWWLGGLRLRPGGGAWGMGYGVCGARRGVPARRRSVRPICIDPANTSITDCTFTGIRRSAALPTPPGPAPPRAAVPHPTSIQQALSRARARTSTFHSRSWLTFFFP